MYKTRITDLQLSTMPLTNGCRNDDVISLVHSILSRCFSSSRSVMHILYTFSCSIPTCCNQLDSNLANFRGHSWDGINYGVSVSNNAMVAPAWWGFHVSQGSLETVFRWGGKRLHDCRTFIKETVHQLLSESPEFYRRYYQKTFWCLFSGHSVVSPAGLHL